MKESGRAWTWRDMGFFWVWRDMGYGEVGKLAKENWDRPPTLFGLKVALPILLQYFTRCGSRSKCWEFQSE